MASFYLPADIAALHAVTHLLANGERVDRTLAERLVSLRLLVRDPSHEGRFRLTEEGLLLIAEPEEQ